MASCRFRPNKHSPTTAIRFFKIILRKTLEEGNLVSLPGSECVVLIKVRKYKREPCALARKRHREMRHHSSVSLRHSIVKKDYLRHSTDDLHLERLTIKIKIPNNFTRKYGGGLQNPVYLNPSDGTEWKVHWTKHDGGILFEKGWKEFASYYSLDHGHLVLFEYKETSHFEVYIFDMSGLEIDYPDDTVEILNEPPPCKGQKRKRKSPLSSPSTSKKLRTAIRTSSPNPQGSQSEGTSPEMPSANQDLHASEALKEAKKFKSKNPSFIVNIKPSHLRPSYAPHFSVVFFRKYFKKNKQNVKLRFGRKLWPAKLIYYPSKPNTLISAGWPHFTKASELQAGDVCIFELVNREVPVLDVHIFRGLEIDYPDDTVEVLNAPPPCKGQNRRLKSPLLSPSTSKKLRTAKRTSHNPDGGQFEETKLEMPVVASVNQDLHGRKATRRTSMVISHTNGAMKEAEKFTSENPFFIVSIKPSFMGQRRPVVPTAFIKKYLINNKKQILTLQFGNKLWRVMLLCYTYSTPCRLSNGWLLFARESGLKSGDVCIFELINTEGAVFDVHIFTRR